MKKSKTALKRKLDKLWRSQNKDSAHCEICQTLPAFKRIHYTQLHPHHIIGRTHIATRFDPRNRLWVCPYHHTMGPATEIVQDNLGGWFLNWESDNDWMGKHRPEDKEHLRYLKNVTKIYSLFELEDLIESYE